MDFEQTQVRLPTLSEFNDKIKQSIDATVKKLVMRLMDNIAQGEDLSLEYLLTKYGKILNDISVEPVTRKQRKIIESKDRCLAKINGSGRCSRKRKDKLYCGGHAERRPHGEFTVDDVCIDTDNSNIDDSTNSIESEVDSNHSNASNASNASKKSIVAVKKQ